MLLRATALILLLISASANAAVIGIRNGNSLEQAQITQTLIDMGHTVSVKGLGDYSGIDVFLSYSSIGGAGPTVADVNSGINFIQMSDHGGNGSNPPVFSDGVDSHGDGTVITLNVDDNGHALTQGLDSSFNAFGFWRYGISTSWVGFVTDPSLDSLISEVSVANKSHVLTSREIGAGKAVYIGWNVYGVDAGANDLQVLSNAINWTTSVPAPSTMILFLLGSMLVAARKVAGVIR